MTDPATMTNLEIGAKWTAATTRQGLIARELIRDGHGALRGSDMKKNPDVHPRVPEYLELCDQSDAMGKEARRRYGPTALPSQIAREHGGRYRRESNRSET